MYNNNDDDDSSNIYTIGEIPLWEVKYEFYYSF